MATIRAVSTQGPGAPAAAADEVPLLRFITCGSVDDGKSTLVGRLLFDCGGLSSDQLDALQADSTKFGTCGGEPDYALLFDGLEAEREQGITIDVAYRFFSSAQRKFIVADAPGHEQYTRNMITGASTADLAIILIDARRGMLPQTRRHCFLVALMGLRHIVFAVTKMDLVSYHEGSFSDIAGDCRRFAATLGLHDITVIPVSGAAGDNVVSRSERMPWYPGNTLLQQLEAVTLDELRLQQQPLRFPVQWVNRANADFRGYCGTLVSGTVTVGQRVCVQPSGRVSTIARIVSADGDLACGVGNQALTLVLSDAVDISRGDMIAAADAPAELAASFEATLVWMSEAPLLQGREYLLKIATRTVTATVAPLKYRIDVNSLEHLAAETLAMNEIGVAELQLDRAIAFDPYAQNHDTGGFILIDRITSETVAAGMLRFALRRSHNLRWQAVDIDKAAHAGIKGQRPCVLWLTGLSGAGKSTIANLLEKRLFADGRHTYLLDGDNVRHGLNKDLGFTAADRVENIRRVAEVARLMVDAGLIVITAFISPFRNERQSARALFEHGEFVEIHVDVPLAVAEERDSKGLYKKARAGSLPNFTGIDSPYEPPAQPDIRIDTTALSPADAVELILVTLRDREIVR